MHDAKGRERCGVLGAAGLDPALLVGLRLKCKSDHFAPCFMGPCLLISPPGPRDNILSPSQISEKAFQVGGLCRLPSSLVPFICKCLDLLKCLTSKSFPHSLCQRRVSLGSSGSAPSWSSSQFVNYAFISGSLIPDKTV